MIMPTLTLSKDHCSSFSCGIVLRDGTRILFDHNETVKEGGATSYLWNGPGVRGKTRVVHERNCGGLTLETQVQFHEGFPENIDSILLFSSPQEPGRFTRVFQNRRDVWLPAGTRNADGSPCPAGPDPKWDADNLIALFTPGQRALLAGVSHPCHYGIELSYRDEILEIRMPLTRQPGAGERIDCDAVYVNGSSPLLEGLEWYGKQNRFNARAFGYRHRFTVWNSWDWFKNAVTQEDIVAMADCIRADSVFGAHVNVLALDDGWQKNWDTGAIDEEKFPDLAAMARAIGDRGMVPGIWYAPFRLHPDAAWVREHPETVLWGEPRPVFKVALTPKIERRVLDYTHPLVLRKIYEDLRRLYEAGFRYYKTDFIQHPNTYFSRPDLYDKSITPSDGVRRVMHTIRAAIGFESYWLVCGTEPAAVAGLPDAARVGDDISYRFGAQQQVVRNCAHHFWMNGNLWINDPDFLIVRGKDTQDTPYLSKYQEESHTDPSSQTREYQLGVLGTGDVVGLEEARCWANFHIMYGGALSLGDHPARLNSEGKKIIEKVFAYHGGGKPGIPLDIEERNLPGKWLRPYEQGWLLGLFNFYDEPMRMSLSERDRNRIGAIERCEDIWSGHEERIESAQWSLELPPHTSRVFRLYAGA
ncbi:MAG: hypothetical protein GF344_09980 [Chitinivibrionales bacterium]|nr:hypothetical protein [Chitinivibrionales bacterium]